MKIRKRISIDENLYNAALKYASLDHRTFSELVEESLKQIMKRYPKDEIEFGHERLKTLEKLAEKLIEENREIKAKIERTSYRDSPGG